ncbi:hypothetical protein AMAG_19703 [Allomyces macrogynus ATCC 38327]|uniref:Uncharacterized protein n=1 Tax=Allomyces macrogynus (strain ATCC 38327) TaxID=578462 RepID=A0A0L0SZI3_ALLM3|nr:hypothetical protein AMAG_19703 [Allomyces macrogynus ATCC 38327]|eukprot:KNE67739.1 hypothetical protein AMAG_19703 [Allomyces macrogynus ATCC 38327]
MLSRHLPPLDSALDHALRLASRVLSSLNDILPANVATLATKERVAAAFTSLAAIGAARAIDRMLRPPQHLRKHPCVAPWILLRTMIQGKGFLEQRDALFDTMSADALKHG